MRHDRWETLPFDSNNFKYTSNNDANLISSYRSGLY